MYTHERLNELIDENEQLREELAQALKNQCKCHDLVVKREPLEKQDFKCTCGEVGKSMGTFDEAYEQLSESETNPAAAKKYVGDAKGSDDYSPQNGYVLIDKGTGKKFQRWVDKAGNFREKEI